MMPAKASTPPAFTRVTISSTVTDSPPVPMLTSIPPRPKDNARKILIHYIQYPTSLSRWESDPGNDGASFFNFLRFARNLSASPPDNSVGSDG